MRSSTRNSKFGESEQWNYQRASQVNSRDSNQLFSSSKRGIKIEARNTPRHAGTLHGDF